MCATSKKRNGLPSNITICCFKSQTVIYSIPLLLKAFPPEWPLSSLNNFGPAGTLSSFRVLSSPSLSRFNSFRWNISMYTFTLLRFVRLVNHFSPTYKPPPVALTPFEYLAGTLITSRNLPLLCFKIYSKNLIVPSLLLHQHSANMMVIPVALTSF